MGDQNLYGFFSYLRVRVEIWYTYGWVDGDHVNLRRTDYLNKAIPAHVNWIVNSLYDAAICLTGLFWVWLAGGKTLRLFESINVWVFLIIFIAFVGKMYL